MTNPWYKYIDDRNVKCFEITVEYITQEYITQEYITKEYITLEYITQESGRCSSVNNHPHQVLTENISYGFYHIVF